jgi:lambda family phage portal protein
VIRNPIQRAASWLVDALRPLAATPAYNSTGNGLATKGWDPGDDAINALIRGGGDKLRRQSRDLERRNAWAANAIESFVANAIGSGIVPNFRHPDPAERKRVHQLWLRWTDQADAAGLTDFYGQQSLACRTTVRDGEMLTRYRPRRAEDGLVVPLQLQLLEADHLPLTKNEDLGNGRRIRWGIEFDPIGRRQAYHLYREHPGEAALFFNAGAMTRVDAADVAHLYKPMRPGQHRGQPWLAPVILALHELEKYDRAELVRKGVAAMIAFFEQDVDGQWSQMAFSAAGEKLDSGIPIQGVEPGSYVRVPMGKRVEMNEPSDVGGMYPQYMAIQLRKIAAGIGLADFQLSGDMTQVNYSSARIALIEFRRRCEAFQHQVMVFQFCRPAWRQFIAAAVLSGAISARAYAADPQAYLDVEWTPPAWPWVDPEADVDAEIKAIDALLKSRTKVMKAWGWDRESMDDEIDAEQKDEARRSLKRNQSNIATKPQQKTKETEK